MKIIAAVIGVLALLIGVVFVSHMNNVPRLEEGVKASFAQVQNQYQRRADLIPNLVSTVKGYASHEKETLTAVTEARAKVGQMSVSKDILTNPQAFQAFEKAQGELSKTLSRLMMVSERYPDLKADKNFLALQSQLEGTENRIAVARKDYIAEVQKYNIELKTVPGRWVAAILYPEAAPKESFSAAPENQNAPKVAF